MRIRLDQPDPLPESTRGASRGAAPAQKAHGIAGEDSYSHDYFSAGELTGRALQTPSVRWDKVDGLRQNVRDGGYQLDPESIAEAMLKG